MGQGLVIEPSQGELIFFDQWDSYGSFSYQACHRYCLLTEVELLIHIGMDTVGLDGKGFESFVA